MLSQSKKGTRLLGGKFKTRMLSYIMKNEYVLYLMFSSLTLWFRMFFVLQNVTFKLF